MYRFADRFFDSGGLPSDGGRVYEFSGHLGSMGIVGLVLGLILWAVVVTALVLVIMELIRRYRTPRTTQAPLTPQPLSAQPVAVLTGSEALTILDERYARGEIGHEEYAERRKDLTGTAEPSVGGPPAAGQGPAEGQDPVVPQ